MIEKPFVTRRSIVGTIIVFGLFAGWRFAIEHSFQGPPQNRFLVTNARPLFNTHTLAAAVRHESFLGPSKLTRVLTFGFEPTFELRPSALIFVGDIDTARGELLARIASPDNTSSGFEPRIQGWGDDCVFVEFTGQRGSFWNGSQGPIHHRFYRVGLDGSVAEFAQAPHTPAIDDYRPMPGETRFMRLSADILVIKVQTDPRGRYRSVFRFDPLRSAIVPASDSAETESR